MTEEERTSLSAVRHVYCAVGLSRRALMKEDRILMRISAEAKERPKRAPRPAMTIDEVANKPAKKYSDYLDPSVESDKTAIIDVTMGSGTILFTCHRSADVDGNPIGGSTIETEGVQKPIGDTNVLTDLLEGEESRAIARDQAGVTALSEAQLRQAVTVIPASY